MWGADGHLTESPAADLKQYQLGRLVNDGRCACAQLAIKRELAIALAC